jgi:signal transduction histidine kinase
MKNKSISALDGLARENARLRGDLLAISSRITHDLRTPLGGISITGELLREMLAEKEPSAKAAVNSIFTSVDEMNRLIKCISVVTKASANPGQKKPVDMAEIVSGVMQRLESRVLKKGAAVSGPDSWPTAAGVAGWLEFIWWSLLANALQHGGDQIRLGWERRKNETKFWISDNGGGVPVELRAKLFQTFDSLHQPGSTPGLGLSVVQRLVELQGGHCGYEPKPKGEARFFFTLPAS